MALIFERYILVQLICYNCLIVKEVNIPDLTKLTWQLNIALIGAVFSVASLIYNETYIYYGFVTFLYGVLGHILDILTSQFSGKSKYLWFFVVQFSLISGWLVLLARIYR